MIDISSLIEATESELLDVAKQAFTLASGLQNAAPGQHAANPSHSVLYLFEIGQQINACAEKCKNISENAPLDQVSMFYDLMQQIVLSDQTLREQYGIKDKFRFVRDHLAHMFADIEKNMLSLKQEEVSKSSILSDEELVVYVYLFNAQGLAVETWRKMVAPSVFYEYSVNRPIYLEKEHVESFISRKANKLQHAYLAIVIKKHDVLANEALVKDIYDNALIKVREGSLHIGKVITFTHNNMDYIVKIDGALVRKT